MSGRLLVPRRHLARGQGVAGARQRMSRVDEAPQPLQTFGRHRQVEVAADLGAAGFPNMAHTSQNHTSCVAVDLRPLSQSRPQVAGMGERARLKEAKLE